MGDFSELEIANARIAKLEKELGFAIARSKALAGVLARLLSGVVTVYSATADLKDPVDESTTLLKEIGENKI